MKNSSDTIGNRTPLVAQCFSQLRHQQRARVIMSLWMNEHAPPCFAHDTLVTIIITKSPTTTRKHRQMTFDVLKSL